MNTLCTINRASIQVPKTKPLGRMQHRHHSAIAAFNTAEQQPPTTQFASPFIRPDLPPPGPESKKPRASKNNSVTFMHAPAEAEDFHSSSDPKPVFRSALEQVSYLTNMAAQARQ